MISNWRLLYLFMIIQTGLTLYFGYKFYITKESYFGLWMLFNVIGASANSIKLSR